MLQTSVEPQLELVTLMHKNLLPAKFCMPYIDRGATSRKVNTILQHTTLCCTTTPIINMQISQSSRPSAFEM